MKLPLKQSLVGKFYFISSRIFVLNHLRHRASLLAEYSLAFKQFDSVWNDINPIFQLYEIIPLKPTEFPPESMFLITYTPLL